MSPLGVFTVEPQRTPPPTALLGSCVQWQWEQFQQPVFLGGTQAAPSPLEVGIETGWLRCGWRYHSFTSWLCDLGQPLEPLKSSVPSSLKWANSASLTVIPRIACDDRGSAHHDSWHSDVQDVVALDMVALVFTPGQQ